MDRGLDKILSRNIARRIFRGAGGNDYLQDIRINTDTGLAFDAKGNMNPEFNQVPVFVFQGEDKITIDSLSALSTEDIWELEIMFIPQLPPADYYCLIGHPTLYSTRVLINSVGDIIFAMSYSNFPLEGTSINCNIVAEQLNIFKIRSNGDKTVTITVNNDIFTRTFNDHGIFNFSGIGVVKNDSYYKGKMIYLRYNSTLIPFQNFAGNKVYSTDGSITGTITGSGSWWTRADGIPSMNQANGFKLVSLDSGANEAYIPLAVSDATLTADLTAAGHTVDSITELTQDGKSFLNDGSELDLHPTVSDLVVELGDEIVFNGIMDDSDLNDIADNWEILTGSTPSIVSGNGFSGYAQRMDYESSHLRFRQNNVFEAGKRYLVSFYYRSNTFVRMFAGNTEQTLVNTSVSNIGNAIKVEAEVNVSYDGYVYFYISGDVGVWAEISAVSVKEITTLSDYLDSIEAASGIDLNSYKAGSPLPAEYKHTIYPEKTTTGIRLLKEAPSNLAYQGLMWDSVTDTYYRLGSIRNIATGISAGDDYLPIQSQMKRCLLLDDGTVNYYLDPIYSTKKADRTASDLTGADGQVMVEIPKFYVKQGLVDGSHYWNISLRQLSGYVVHPAFIKNGVEVDYRYYSAYEGSMFDASTGAMCAKASIATNLYAAGDKMCSVSGQWAKTNETRAEYRSMAAERGTGWRQLDYFLHSAVQLLYLIEYADFNSQAMIGDGRTNLSGGAWAADSYIGKTGLSNSLGNASGNVSNGGSAGYLTDFMSYRGIENLFGNVWKMIDGLTIDGSWLGAPAAQPAYATNDDSLFADQGDMGMAKLCDISYIGSNTAYIGDIEDAIGFMPKSGGANSTTKLCDYYYQYSIDSRNYWRVPLISGYASYDSRAGVFAFSSASAWSTNYVTFGGRLCF